MKYYDLLKSIQYVKNGVLPDSKILASLHQIPEKDLAGLNISKDLKEFFWHVGTAFILNLRKNIWK